MPQAEPTAAYVTDRCGASIEVKRDTFTSCGLKHGHEGAHEPVNLGKQTASESAATEVGMNDPLHDALVAVFEAIAQREEKSIEEVVAEFVEGYERV